MKDIFEDGRSDLIFYHYYDSICKVKYCKIWPKCTIFIINILLAPKNDNDQKNEERKYNDLKEKIFIKKKCIAPKIDNNQTIMV